MRYAIVVLVAAICCGAANSGLPSTSALSAAQDHELRAGTQALLQTFYHPLDARTLLVAERRALVALAGERALPPVPLLRDASVAPSIAVDEATAAVVRGHANADRAVYVALGAMAHAANDRYTRFFTPDEYRKFDAVLDPAKLSGVGMLLDLDPQTKYVRAYFVMPETPAERAGIHSGDDIERVNGLSTRGMTVPQARAHIIGPEGTHVRLDLHGRTLDITRATIQPPTVYFTMLPNAIAYLYIAAFGEPTAHEFDNAVARMQQAGARAFVLDLRNDGGGIVGTAISVSSHFVASGPIVSIESNGGRIDTIEADANAIDSKPLAVLVNGYTASAAEITAAAIQESGAGMIFGTRTFGKGVVQSVTHFPDGSALKITTGHYYTPLNHDINHRGVEPNVVVQENAKAVFGTPEKDGQLQKAVDYINGVLAHRENARPV